MLLSNKVLSENLFDGLLNEKWPKMLIWDIFPLIIPECDLS